MSEINNTDRLRKWLQQCPAIAKGKYFGADYIGEKSTEYAVFSVPSTKRYKENILGMRTLRETQEQNFIFAAKVPYGSNVQQNLSNLAFFQNVSDWILQTNAAREFPEWSDGAITAIEVTNTGAPVQTGADAARYQFQIKVTYKIQ